MSRNPKKGKKATFSVHSRVPVIQVDKRIDIAPKLEKAFLHEFRAYFGKVPLANVRGSKRLELEDEARYVNLDKVREILIHLSH